MRWAQVALWAALAGGMLGPAWADPCGMVPPVSIPDPTAIIRIGDQMTYVFYKDGVETFVIRPGFRGKVEEFGMLIPFPTPPAIRKMPDNIFQHIQAAIDPPEVVVDLRWHFFALEAQGAVRAAAPAGEAGLKLRRNQVRVIREEAVGMYEVAVLEAGSAQALKRWMTQHRYRYPNGMDKVCEEYIAQGWCFVAVKTRITGKRQVDPRPGQRRVRPGLPPGASFDGYVQAMGFRFRTPELVVPMRLSAYNEGELHNIVYLLTDGPRKINAIPEEYVVRQISGRELLRNITQPLPLRIIGGTEKDIPDWRRQHLPQQRDPTPHNGHARDLFASDLLAVQSGQLSLAVEEQEKMLLRIGEELYLRGPQIDQLHLQVLRDQLRQATQSALKDLEGMTLTVVDGDFPRKVLANQNLTFSPYRMPAFRNSPRYYDAKLKGPAPRREGRLILGQLELPDARPTEQLARLRPRALMSVAVLVGLMVGALVLWQRRAAGALLVVVALASSAWAQGVPVDQKEEEKILQLIDQLEDSKRVDQAVKQLVDIGPPAVQFLIGEAVEGPSWVRRGWAIVALSRIPGPEAQRGLQRLLSDRRQPELIRTWAAAAVIQRAQDFTQLVRWASLAQEYPPVQRALRIRLTELIQESEKPPTARELLRLAADAPVLQSAVAAVAVHLPVEELLKPMLHDRNQQLRRMAAAFLATKAQRSKEQRDQVAQAVLKAYRFDPQVKEVPWAGGPLFLPAVQWTPQEARQIVGTLIRWLLWCQRRGKNPQPIINNLRSVQWQELIPGFNPFVPTPRVQEWLLAWGVVVGREQIRAILAQQGVDKDPQFAAVLDQIPQTPQPSRR